MLSRFTKRGRSSKFPGRYGSDYVTSSQQFRLLVKEDHEQFQALLGRWQDKPANFLDKVGPRVVSSTFLQMAELYS